MHTRTLCAIAHIRSRCIAISSLSIRDTLYHTVHTRISRCPNRPMPSRDCWRAAPPSCYPIIYTLARCECYSIAAPHTRCLTLRRNFLPLSTCRWSVRSLISGRFLLHGANRFLTCTRPDHFSELTASEVHRRLVNHDRTISHTHVNRSETLPVVLTCML